MTTTRQRNAMLRSTRNAFIVGSCLAVIVCSLWRQSVRVQAQNDLSVTASFNSQTPLNPDTPIELHLNRTLQSDEGRITIVIGKTDLTSMFIADGTRLVYSPTLVPLPLGASEVLAYRVIGDGNWKEIARFAIVVGERKPATPSAPVTATTTLTANGGDAQTSPPVNAGGSEAKAGPPATASRSEEHTSELQHRFGT